MPFARVDSDSDADQLVCALQRVRDAGKKSLIRSTDHQVTLNNGAADSQSALIQDADDDVTEDGSRKAAMSPAKGAGTSTITLTSWKTQEFAYRKVNKIGFQEDAELPTLARGLFTCSEPGGKHRIVVRGYDKFFNEGEMPWTRPDALAAFSRPPYELSFKENGCIIFISALSPSQLIVTSKHSLGENESHTISHAQKGEEWLEKHLRSVGKRKADLALKLWESNETAVSELCDDSFEEHVLAYPTDRTGLHLHGLNANTAHFQTRSMVDVDSFARQWGFLPTRFRCMNSLENLNRLVSTVAETGQWEGIAIEGFVVRTRIPNMQEVTNGSAKIVPPPYAPGQTWFYKIKFEEPYLMYREWRELARKMLSEKTAYEGQKGAGKMVEQPGLPKLKKKRAETQLFVQWCHQQLYGSSDGKSVPRLDLFDQFHQNQGIIRLRETFIEYMSSEEGTEKLSRCQGLTAKSAGNDIGEKVPFTKTLLIPIAVPGCGKTALAVALKHLFPGMGHTQSDNVQTKKTGPTFLRNISNELHSHDIVFADRNNHLFKHRDEIVKNVAAWEAAAIAPKQSKSQGKRNKENRTAPDTNTEVPESPLMKQHVRLVAIVWPLEDLPLNAVHHLCADRLVMRGANHQSLRVEDGKEHEHIIWQFLQTRQPFRSQSVLIGEEGTGDEAFDEVITLDFFSSIEQMVSTCAQQLASFLSVPQPSPSAINLALDEVKNYRVNLKKEVKRLPATHIRYYGLSIAIDLSKDLQHLVAADTNTKEALHRLINAKRVIERPHVTLVHESELKADDCDAAAHAQTRWDSYSSLYLASPAAVNFDVKVDCIAWDNRAMSLGVSQIHNEKVVDLYSLQGKSWRPHITIGTFNEDIRPFEGRRVLCDADAGSKHVTCLRFKNSLHIIGRLRGLN